jgi:hypothetical protein
MEQPTLKNTQRWMQSVITHPAGVKAGVAAAKSQTDLDNAVGNVEQIIEPSAQQSSIERLAVYTDAYYARLIECLQAEFPIFRQNVGDETFAEFAVGSLQRYPSRTYTLGKLGEKFVDYLNETRPTSDGTAWPDFLIDLALLERTISEVFDGRGVEGISTISHEQLLSIDPDRWPQARLTTVPCLRLLSLRFPLNNYYTAMKANQEVSIPSAENSWIAITRRDYIVRRYELAHPQFVLLAALHEGKTIGDAVGAAADAYSGDTDRLAADLRTWFQSWAAAPMFASIAID